MKKNKMKMKTSPTFKTNPLFLIILALGFLALSPRARAVNPPPDGGYAGFNTAEGTNALQHLTTGVANAALGWYSLFNNTDGAYNTPLGAGTLLFKVGDQSTGEGIQNTAIGAAALLFNATGHENTAVGAFSLFTNTIGEANTATGWQALLSNTIGFRNTASGAGALYGNTEGSFNTASGFSALYSNTIGGANTATGAV